MTDHLDSLPDPSDDELAALAALLSRAEPWDEPPRDLEDAVVAAIADEAATARRLTGPSRAETRARAVWSRSRMLGAAAAIAVVVAGLVLMTRGSTDGVTFALEGTDAEPGATASVVVSATPAGLKILLDCDGLPGAPEGYMYEAWVGDGTIGVSAGTFHLRGGDGPIELWAGVTGNEFHRLWITLEPIDDDAASSSDARMRGEFSLPDD
ncbi:MAG: anti-sigma factor [Ilumatobacteraceae bacterium]|nr:anti-sigma factor [Ilumatobacteraceae bacterium]